MRSLVSQVLAQTPSPSTGIYNPALSETWRKLSTETAIARLIAMFLHLMLIGAGIAALFYLIMGGIQWITSGGDKAGVAAARDKITAAFIGLAIVACLFAFINFIAPLLGLEFLQFFKYPELKLPTIGGE